MVLNVDRKAAKPMQDSGDVYICRHKQLARQCAICDEVELARLKALEEAAAVCEAYAQKHAEDTQTNDGLCRLTSARYCAEAIRALAGRE
jgi:hypothetical protein